MTSQTLTAPVLKSADTEVALHPLLAERWSPRSFAPDHVLDDTTMTALLEAARWAPSAGNTQPWRFLVGRRGEATFEELASLLRPGNQTWAPHASALVLVATKTRDDRGRPLPWASYDAGLAVATMTVQAQHQGLAIHQMGGFDAEGARHQLQLDDTLEPVVVLAVGIRDEEERLPAELAERERAPRTRAPLESLLLPRREAGERAG